MKNRPFAKAFEIFAKFRAELPEKLPLFAKKGEERGALYIYDVIGEDWWTGGGVTAAKVVEALAALKGVKALDVFINSPGGDVFEAKAIITNLQRFDAEKVVHIDGVAASAATCIAMAGDRIITAAHATWMVHEASAMAFGRADDMRAMADLLEKQNLDMAELYAKQTGQPVEAMLKVMADETWMSAKEALEAGFTDEIAAEDEDSGDSGAAAAKSPLVAAALTTEQRVRLARQSRRLEQLSRASPGARHGQP